MGDPIAVRHVTLHGRRIAYRTAGAGPVVVLIHGMAGSSETWNGMMRAAGGDHTWIAIDLPGHGSSDPPHGDYSLGAHATIIRDLLIALGHRRATIVGHSLGGGIAMQFAYQFPERIERLVLVNSGGLGRDVHGLLRALAFPGAEYVLAAACAPRVVGAGRTVNRWLHRAGLRPAPGASDVWRGYEALSNPSTRTAFIQTLRSVVDVRGQRVGATDRLYLAAALPTMIVWGKRDPFIPIAHGLAAHQAVAGSRLNVFLDAGHFPHRDDPAGFAEALRDFLSSTRPADPAHVGLVP